MSRYREISQRDDQHCTLTLWPGEELRDGSDTLELEYGDAYIRFTVQLQGVHFEVNQLAQGDGSDRSVMTWCLLGRSGRELVVADPRGGEPVTCAGIEVTLLPATANAVHLTAPVSGLGIRAATLRLFVDRAHLEVLRDRVEAGRCTQLEAIVRVPLLHHAEEAVYLLDDAAEYDGGFESLRAEVGSQPAAGGGDGAGPAAPVATGDGEALQAPAERGPDGVVVERLLVQQRFIIGALGVVIALLLLRLL